MHFLIRSFFKSLYFQKWCPIFDTSPLHQFSKLYNFLWVCWFLGKNLSNFVPSIENSTIRITIVQGISYWNISYELTLIDRNMQARISLKMVLKLWGLDILVSFSLTSFWKSNIGWPQKPPIERVQTSVKIWIFDDPFHKKGPFACQGVSNHQEQ